MTDAELRDLLKDYDRHIPPHIARRILELDGYAFPAQTFQQIRAKHDIHPHFGWYPTAEILAVREERNKTK